eukprot:superscaffoldBa00006237_g21291
MLLALERWRTASWTCSPTFLGASPPAAEGQGPAAPSPNVTLHLCPTAGVWHPTQASATCAGCQLAVHADICCVSAGGARSVSATTNRRPNNVLYASLTTCRPVQTSGRQGGFTCRDLRARRDAG